MSLFGRHDPDPDPCDPALRELLYGPPEGPPPLPDRRAMARNLMHDEHVPRARQEVLDGLLPPPVTAAGLAEGVTRYHKTRIRYQKHPDFIDPELNRENILSGLPLGEHRVHKDLPLARILDLNGLFFLYSDAEVSDWFREFGPVPSEGPDESALKTWLERHLSGRAEVRRRFQPGDDLPATSLRDNHVDRPGTD